MGTSAPPTGPIWSSNKRILKLRQRVQNSRRSGSPGPPTRLPLHVG
jgi:hypothetical protein